MSRTEEDTTAGLVVEQSSCPVRQEINKPFGQSIDETPQMRHNQSFELRLFMYSLCSDTAFCCSVTLACILYFTRGFFFTRTSKPQWCDALGECRHARFSLHYRYFVRLVTVPAKAQMGSNRISPLFWTRPGSEKNERSPRRMSCLKDIFKFVFENAQVCWNNLNEYSTAFQGFRSRLILLQGVKRRLRSIRQFSEF